MNVLVIVAHGSRNPQSNQEIIALTELISGQNHGFDRISHAFLEMASPDIPTALEQCITSGAKTITVLPYFLARGNHVARDIPEIIQPVIDAHPEVQIEVTTHIGSARGISALILDHLQHSQ